MKILRVICFVSIFVSCIMTQISVIDLLIQKYQTPGEKRSAIMETVLYYLQEIAFYIVVYARVNAIKTWWGLIIGTAIVMMCGDYEPTASNVAAKQIRAYSVIMYILCCYKYVKPYPTLWIILKPLIVITIISLIIMVPVTIMSIIVSRKSVQEKIRNARREEQ